MSIKMSPRRQATTTTNEDGQRTGKRYVWAGDFFTKKVEMEIEMKPLKEEEETCIEARSH